MRQLRWLNTPECNVQLSGVLNVNLLGRTLVSVFELQATFVLHVKLGFKRVLAKSTACCRDEISP